MIDYNKISSGQSVPDVVNVIIEIAKDSHIKYEFDKESQAMVIDRFLATPMHYPFNYGFIPHTLSEDGDPCDVIILSDRSCIPGSLMSCKVIAVLSTVDENGIDPKIVVVPSEKVDIGSQYINDLDDIQRPIRDKITHFFQHYKDLEPNKWVKIADWSGAEKAKQIISDSILRLKNQNSNNL